MPYLFVSGELWTRQSLDREQQALYEVPVMAVDGGGRSAMTSVRLTVTDANDNPPQFLQSEYRACIHANLTAHSPFLKVCLITIIG